MRTVAQNGNNIAPNPVSSDSAPSAAGAALTAAKRRTHCWANPPPSKRKSQRIAENKEAAVDATPASAAEAASAAPAEAAEAASVADSGAAASVAVACPAKKLTPAGATVAAAASAKSDPKVVSLKKMKMLFL